MIEIVKASGVQRELVLHLPVEAEDGEQEVEGSRTAMERNDLRKSLDRSFNP